MPTTIADSREVADDLARLEGISKRNHAKRLLTLFALFVPLGTAVLFLTRKRAQR